jgi:hypothetical protein
MINEKIYRYGLLMGAGHPEHLDVAGKIILKWILGKWVVRLWTTFICLRIDSNRGCCERGDEPSGFIKGTEFLSGRFYFQLYGSISVILLNRGGWTRVEHIPCNGQTRPRNCGS